MKNNDQLLMADSELGRKVAMALLIVLGTVSGAAAWFCYYIMNIAGLLAFSGFLLFSAILVGCVGALVIYVREGKGFY